MNKDKMLMLAALFVASLMSRDISTQDCGADQYSVYKAMLKGHTFKTLKVRPRSLDCRQACIADVRRQSYNYVMHKHICELNNRTKEARPEHFVQNEDRYYITRAPKRGNGNLILYPYLSCTQMKR